MMRYLLILFLVMVFIVGCGCSNSLTFPAYADDSKDVWPIFYGTDNGGPDNGYIVFWDQLAGAWQAPRLVDNDLLDGQWTPQRNAVGWRGGRDLALNPGGQWNVSFVEDTGNDLEMWASPDDGWQDDGAGWAMVDGDASVDYGAVDVETRQNYVWAIPHDNANNEYLYYINLSAGVPAWTNITAVSSGYDNTHYSICLDDNLRGGLHYIGVSGGALQYEYAYWEADVIDNLLETNEYPQIIVDKEEALWVFSTDSNTLLINRSFDSPWNTVWDGSYIIYTATALTSDYHATWLAYDDTIHLVLVDEDTTAPNSTFLIYLRRTPNGWTAPVALLTVSSDVGNDEFLYWPQICVDKIGNMFVSYISSSPAIGLGDLQGFYLDATDYSTYTVIGAGGWIQHTDIEGSGVNDIEWAIMPNSVPITMGM